MVMTCPWLLMRVTTMRRLGGSVNADVVIINSVTMGDRVVMGNGKFREVGGRWDIDNMLDWTTVGGDVIRSNLVSLRLCIWLCGVIKILQFKGVE
jgi:hypothetical protein